MSEVNNMNKQSITGLKVSDGPSIKKTKDGEVLKIVLTGNVEDLKANGLDIGQIMKGLLFHLSSETEVGLSVLVSGK